MAKPWKQMLKEVRKLLSTEYPGSKRSTGTARKGAARARALILYPCRPGQDGLISSGILADSLGVTATVKKKPAKGAPHPGARRWARDVLDCLEIAVQEREESTDPAADAAALEIIAAWRATLGKR